MAPGRCTGTNHPQSLAMNGPPRRSKWMALLGSCLVACGAFLLAGPPGSRADDKPPPGVLPAEVERLVRWLPEDTETLIVARSIPFPAAPPGGNPSPPGGWDEPPGGWAGLGVSIATAGLDAERCPPLRPLVGRRVARVVRGAKNYDTVTKFGGLRSEGCTVVVFDAPLPDEGRAAVAGFRLGAQETRTVAGREVFGLPSTIEKGRFIDGAPWEGTFLVLLAPDTLLVASSDRYLDAVLHPPLPRWPTC